MDTEHAAAGAFRRQDGIRSGISRARLDGPHFRRPFHGLRSWNDGESDAAALLERCRHFASVIHPGEYISHGTALELRGIPVPSAFAGQLHVSVHRPQQAPRRAGVIGHRLQPRPTRIEMIGPLPVAAASAAWAQVLGHWPHDDLVIAGDRIVTPRKRLATLGELRAESIRARRKRVGELVLGDVREGSESPRETRLRLLILRSGLPEPVLAFELFSDRGAFVARLDMAYPEQRIAVEYDGRQHAESTEQFARDADRWYAIAQEGWVVVRILNHHLRDSGRTAIARIRAALAAR